MKKLTDYIQESQQWMESPGEGDTFGIELADDTLLETYVMEVADDGSVLLDSTPEIYSLLESWNMLSEDIDTDVEEDIDADRITKGHSRRSTDDLEEMAPLAAVAGGALARAAAGHVASKIGDALDGEEPVNEFDMDARPDPGEYDTEGDMAKNELLTIIRAARKLTGMLDDEANMPEWTQKKITKAADYVDTAADYISSQRERGVMEQSVAEEFDIESAREKLASLKRELKSVTGNYPGDDRNRMLFRRQIFDLKAQIKAAGGKKSGVAEGKSLQYTVVVRGNDFSYSKLADALTDGHPHAAKVFKNGNLIGTIGSLSKQGVAEGSGATADRKQAKLDAFEKKLAAHGYDRIKDSSGGEYQYQWVKKGAPTYVVNYRFGPNGYAEFWKEQDVSEGSGETSPVARAVLHRIMMAHPGVLAQHGPEKVMSAVDELADRVNIGPDDEIGSSDVSGWVRDVIRMLSELPDESMSDVDRLGESNSAGLPQLAQDIADAIKTGYAGQGFDWDFDDIYDFQVFLGDAFSGESFTDEYENLDEPEMMQVAKMVRQALKGYPSSDLDDSRARAHGLREAEIDDSWMNDKHKEFYKRNPHFKRNNRDRVEVGSGTQLATRVDPSVKPAQVKKKPAAGFGMSEAEYQGRDVPLGKPMRGDVAKFKVYVRDPKTGNVKKVNFGDPNMRIKKSNPARRKSFRARHKCDTAKDRTTARYWSCRKW